MLAEASSRLKLAEGTAHTLTVMKTERSTNSTHEARPNGRREFAKTFAATLIAAPLATLSASAQTPSTTKQATAPPNPQPPPAPMKPSPLAEAYAEVVRARFGDRISPEDLSKITKDIESNMRAAERLRSYKLRNSDEPDFIFSV